jgi:ABC-type transport system involved in multi-copper enzyme maturation permease subunit
MFPVFSLELLLAERRDRYGKLQRRYLKWLGFLCLVALWRLAEEPAVLHRNWTDFFLQFCLIQHAALVFFLTPAFLAGSITDERQQGTLADLLTTELSPCQLLAGKLLAALTQIASLLLAALPPLAFCAGSGFLQPAAVPGLVLLTVTWLLLLGCLSLCASVFSSLARVAVLRVYGLVAVTLLAFWFYVDEMLPWLLRRVGPSMSLGWARGLGEWLHCINPFHVVRPLWLDSDWGEFARRFLRFELLAMVVCGAAFAAAAWRLRSRSAPVTVRRRSIAGSRLHSLEVGDEPILWRESLVSRPKWRLLGVMLTFLAGLAFAVYSIQLEGPWFALLGGSTLIVLTASLLAGIRASGSITVEREAHTWSSLLATPVESKSLVDEKAQAAVQGAAPFLLAPFLPVVAVALWYSWAAGTVVLVIAFLGRTMTRYLAATGVASSVRAHGSWRSLLATLVSGYSRILLFLVMIGVICACYGAIFSYYFVVLLTMPRLEEVTISTAFGFVAGIFCAAGFHLWLRRTAEKDLATAASLVERERTQS